MGRCRLCLNIDQNLENISTNEELCDKIQSVFPETDLSLTQKPKLCQICVRRTKYSYNFRKYVRIAENKIKSQLTHTTEPSKINFIIKMLQSKCRLCIKEKPAQNMYPILQIDGFSEYLIRTMISESLNEFDYHLYENQLICNDCWIIIRQICNIKKIYFENEQKIKTYLTKIKKTCLDESNFDSTPNSKNCDTKNEKTELTNDDNSVINIEKEDLFTEENFVQSDIHLEENMPLEVLLEIPTHNEEISQESLDINNDTLVEDKQEKISPEIKSDKKIVAIDNLSEMKPNKVEKNEVIKPEQSAIFVEIKKISEDLQKNENIEENNNKLDDTKTNIITNKHVKKRKKPQLHVCTHCPYTTMNLQHFKRHSLQHKNKKSLNMVKCPYCPYETYRKDHMKAHCRTHPQNYEENIIYCCKFCDYSTNRRYSLKRHHEQVHDPNFKRAFQCSQCYYVGKRKTDLESHMKSHESKKDFVCTECNYKTIRKSSLKTHMLQHQPFKPFECEKCGYRTNRKEHLKLHITNVQCQKRVRRESK